MHAREGLSEANHFILGIKPRMGVISSRVCVSMARCNLESGTHPKTSSSLTSSEKVRVAGVPA